MTNQEENYLKKREYAISIGVMSESGRVNPNRHSSWWLESNGLKESQIPSDEELYVIKKGEPSPCVVCGGRPRFKNLHDGFAMVCDNPQCAAELRKRNASKAGKASIEKCGSHFATDEWKQYAAEHPELNPVNDPNKNAEMRSHIDTQARYERVAATMMERYGVRNALENPEFAKKASLSWKGWIHQFEEETSTINREELVRRYGRGFEASGGIDGKYILKGEYKFVPREVEEEWKAYSEVEHHFGGVSKAETALADAIEAALPNTEVIRNNRTILAPYELDVFIPSRNLAIEYDGSFWHKDKPQLDLYKTQMCQALGIRLIHVKDYDWINKPDVVKSILRVALGIQSKRVFARKCEVVKIPYNEAKIFLAENHLHGSSIAGEVSIGLRYDGELVQVASFGKYRFGDKEMQGKTELFRLATKKDYEVVGGFSRLMKNACLMLGVNEIVSFVDLGTYDCSGYLKIGFEVVGQSAPSYSWLDSRTMRVIHKQNARRKKLPKLLGDEFRPEETEVENMTRCGWIQVFDCGNAKLLYTLRAD